MIVSRESQLPVDAGQTAGLCARRGGFSAPFPPYGNEYLPN